MQNTSIFRNYVKSIILPYVNTLSVAIANVPPRFSAAEVHAWTAQQHNPVVDLTDAATIDWDLDAAPNANVLLGGNRILSAPTNIRSGGVYTLSIRQPTQFAHTLAYEAGIFCWPHRVVPSLTIRPAQMDPGNIGPDVAISNGNLTVSLDTANQGARAYPFFAQEEDVYFEVTVDTVGAGIIGVAGRAWDLYRTALGADDYSWGYQADGQKKTGGSAAAYGGAWSAADVIGVALKRSTGELYFSLNGVWQDTSDPEAGTNPAYSGLTEGVFPAFGVTSASASGVTFNFGNSAFAHAVPNGFTAVAEAYEIVDLLTLVERDGKLLASLAKEFGLC